MRAHCRGGLPTGLSAVDEAAGIDILCSDKTGNLTRNELAVMSVCPMPTCDEAHILALAPLASSDSGQDPVDVAIRSAALQKPIRDKLDLVAFVPFDPAMKPSEATVRQADGTTITAEVVADMVGIEGKVWAPTPLPEDLHADDFSIFAGVLPEDKYRLVKALRKNGHLVGMCGDGANDAPALRQARMGIAVFTATDVAKSAAGIVLTEPGLRGIVTSVKEGRRTFQRILTHTLMSIVHKVAQVMFLSAGVVITGHAILVPTLMVLMMVTGDFLAMSSSTDNVRPASKQNTWRIRNLTIAGIIMGAVDPMFCMACLATGKFLFGLDTDKFRTLTVITLVFSGQALFYVARDF